ncbi:MAG: hypothetical protein ACXWW5_05450 [Actinomycetota bacterium]
MQPAAVVEAAPTARGGTFAWTLFAGIVAITVPAYFFLSTPSQALATNAVAIAAAVAMLTGLAWHRPQPRAAWLLLALGVGLLAAGEVAYGQGQPTPSLADVLYVSAYPILGLGVLGLMRTARPGRRSIASDVAIVGAGVLIVAIVFLTLPGGQGSDVGAITRAVALGYPLMDVALLVPLIGLLRVPRTRMVPLVMLAVALALTLVADADYALMGWGTTYSVGDAADAIWLLAYGCFGIAMLHPSAARQGAMLRPRSEWTSVSVTFQPRVSEPAGPAVMLQGLTGPAVRLAVDVPSDLASDPIISAAWAHALRFRLILVWSGVLLLGLGGLAIGSAAVWSAPELSSVAATCGIIGTLTLLIGRIGS